MEDSTEFVNSSLPAWLSIEEVDVRHLSVLDISGE
uniref:Uncharacterized protein n=1 Tax=Arundo donax TaxID=35708 RepID=A0A0A9AJB5_ARUDO